MSSAPPMPSSSTSTSRWPSLAARSVTVARDACAYFATFVERLADEEVGGHLDRLRRDWPGKADLELDGDRRARRERLERDLQAMVAEHARVDAAGQRAARRARA